VISATSFDQGEYGKPEGGDRSELTAKISDMPKS